jgi:hypothetical protein
LKPISRPAAVASRSQSRGPRPLHAALAAIAMALTAAGCVSMPSGGPVQSYPVTQGSPGQPESFPLSFPQPPRAGWNAQDIVGGFLTASATSTSVARQYLTPELGKTWRPSGALNVYSVGPDADLPKPVTVNPHTHQKTTTVTISGQVSATLTKQGTYEVPADSTAAGAAASTPTFTLVKNVGGQWRISSVPSQLLISTVSFQDAYQQRNLYYFDPRGTVLVPDPVYVPNQAAPATLLKLLVGDLANPQMDWLTKGAATTAFPRGTTQLGDVTLDGGIATVNLGGKIAKASALVKEQVWAQLSATLGGTGQGGPAVPQVQVDVNGKPWNALDAQGNPVQQPQSRFSPPSGASKTFYYIDRGGYLVSRSGPGGRPLQIVKIGRGVTQLAVSPDNQHLAVVRKGILLTAEVRNGTLSTGIVSKLVRQPGAGYLALSWDPADNLWTTREGQIVVLRGGTAIGTVLPPVRVTAANGLAQNGTFTGLRIAPDGVRVALIVAGVDLYIGAISWQAPTRAGGAPSITIMLSPFRASGGDLQSVAWYGADNVVTLDQAGQAGPVVTEYPVSGGTPPPPIQGEPGMMSLTVCSGGLLVAGLSHGGLVYDTTLNGAWAPLRNESGGTVPTYPG